MKSALVMRISVVSSLSLGLLVGCSKSAPEPAPSDKGTETTGATPSSSAAHPMGAMPPGHMGAGGPAMGEGAKPGPEIAYDAPKTWTSAPNPSPMRKATFKIPKAAGDSEDAELAVSSAAGGVEPNVQRWAKQFGDAKAKTEPRTVNGLKVTIVEIKGTYAGGGPMMGAAAAPKPNQMLLGAIVDSGDSQEFFKMVGPEKTVTAAKPDFEKFVSSLHAK
ncbi:hypothetical protein [Labilithrix luteola]|uniref:hypothetical protein n=1 Tax=Labilithrix luteola TaxID=1391654 RepID=UPI0011BA8BE7|nr:hypothetical protein [Labilithrix luteola]